ncbi:MAG: peptidoglycan DD-metalloendopeptidase family protein [Candidatus Campbellbacteria bacterium]|nr:peptidoglycan DD-metalloendopeptidase family protein [Candidatus Campbellbacteria bacterium]
MKNTSLNALGLGLFLLIGVSFFSSPLYAAVSLDELQNKINEKSAQIEQIEKDIAKYEKELQTVGGERKTLESAIAQLNLTRQKLLSDITLTQKKIEQTGYSIEKTVSAIQEQEQKIEQNNTVIGHAIQVMHESDNESFVEIVLSKNSLTDIWTEFDQLEQIQTNLRNQLQELRLLKADLSDKKDLEQKEHDSLSAYKSKLDGQKKVIEVNKQQKDQLLTTTKSKEGEYQKLLEEKRLAAQKFESELQDYEAQLQYAQDPSKLPQKGSAVLSWPVENPVITQGFGLTSFALSGAYGYKNGQPNPHRGIDFRASVGTPLLATAAGTVRDAVNMDAVPGCYSYGRWILIDHDNGLSTLYAHMSVMSVSAGEYVKTGQIIGYAGASGYATGPHLHFSVFDRDAVQVSPFSWSIGCKNTRIPFAPYEAYLNPLEYLPKM